jgi:hypothetical protein
MTITERLVCGPSFEFLNGRLGQSSTLCPLTDDRRLSFGDIFLRRISRFRPAHIPAGGGLISLRLEPASSLAHCSAMLVKLAELTKLRRVLQAGAEQFAAEAEKHPEAPAALEFLRIASKIKELERQIEVLTKELLSSQVPQGAS